MGSWSFDHQMMLNSFLQERFLMANLIKNANMEIEKTKAISTKREETLKVYESKVGVLEGFMGKIKSSLTGLSIEQESLISGIFDQYHSYVQTLAIGEPVRMLGDLEISDQRIQSLLREKDAEILRLRDRMFSIEKIRSGDVNS